MTETNPQNTPEELLVHSAEDNEAEKIEALLKHELFEMEVAKTDLENEGKQQIEDTNHLADLDQESVHEVQHELGLQERIAEISARATELLEHAKKAMKKVTVVGMAAVAISGCAGKKDIDLSAYADLKGGSESSTYAENARDHVLAITENPTYLQRLTMELDGDEEEAKRIQQERIQNIKAVQFAYFEDKEALNTKAREIRKTVSQNISMDNTLMEGFTYRSPVKKETTIGLTKDGSMDIANHELSHVSNDGGLNIPQKTAEKLRSLLELETEGAEYFGEPTEVLARKQAIDAKMENVGIKKYEEPYTLEHFQKLLEYEYKELGIKNIKELPKGVALPEYLDFLILYDWDNIVDLFNTTAKNEDASDIQDNPTPIV